MQDTNQAISELTVGDLIRIIKIVMSPSIQRIETIENDVIALLSDLNDNANELSVLKNVLIEQQKSLDNIQKIKREKNLVMSGIKYDDDEDLSGKVNLVLDKLKVPQVKKGIVKMYRIGKMELDNTDEDYRQFLIELQNVETKYNILKESKRLKNWEEIDGKDVSLGTKNIFINLDETPLTRKENARLSKERNRLRSLEENKEKKKSLLVKES